MPSPTFVNTLIRAGAGAGKTTRLIDEVYAYFKTHKNAHSKNPRVVLTTFSNKATQEINERLLKKAIESDDTDFFDFINSKSHLLVSTIHGVLYHFISQNQSEFGLTKDFKIATDADISRRLQKIFRKIVSVHPQAVLLLELFSLAELYSLVKDYRFFSLTEGQLIPFSEVEFRSHLDQLRQEIKKDFQSSIGVLRTAQLSAAWISSLQYFPLSINNDDEIAELIQWEETLDRLPTVPKKGDTEVVGAQGRFVSGIRKLRDFRDKNYHESFLETFTVAQSAFVELAKSFISLAKQEQTRLQEISISDIETLCIQLQSEKPYIFKEFSFKWDFWMIDEFQDTSPTQISLLNLLVGESKAFYVGDPQQSIYYFRGSDSRVFESKFKELSASGKVETLANNYRSHSGVLSFVNEFFLHQYSQFQNMVITKPDLNLDSDVSVFEIVDKKQLAQLAAAQISILVKKEPETRLEDIVILSRTNKDLDDLATELEKLNVPHYVHSQGQFFKQREILDILFFVRFLLDPQNHSNLAFLLRTPSMGMTNEEVKFLLKDFTSWEVLCEGRGAQNEGIQLLQEYLKQSRQLGLVETTQLFSVNEGSFVLNHEVDSSGKKESNVWKLFFWLRQQLGRGLDSFLVQLDSVMTPTKNEMNEESENQAIIEPEKIQMMTIHASKGLQFSHVILIGLNSSPRTRVRQALDMDPETKKFSIFIKNKSKEDKIRSPLYWQQLAIQKERESEEFERLLYVALTRAKKKISMFTLSKYSDASWSRRFFDFYTHYQLDRDNASFKMEWVKLNLEDFDLPKADLNPLGIQLDPLTNVSTNRLTSFLEKIKSLIHEPQNKSPISFSSSRGARTIDIHQILISQRGIGMHQLREKGVVDFSYYSTLEMPYRVSDVFSKGFREYRFTFIFGEFQFVGSIDFVYFAKDRVLIVDYKSGVSMHNELYQQQLQFYAECLSHIKKLNPKTVFDLVIDYIDQKKTQHSIYKSIGSNLYFDNFLASRELENIIS